MSDFQDLLYDAEQLTAQIDKDASGLPRLQRTLSQLYETGRRKLTKNITTDTNEINASILLASRGIDAPKLTQAIENLQIPSSIELQQKQQQERLIQQQQQQQQQTEFILPSVTGIQGQAISVENLKDMDIQQFLKLEKEISLMSTIEEARKETIDEIDDEYWRNCENDWEKQKQKILNSLHSTNNDLANLLQDVTSGGVGASRGGVGGVGKSQNYNLMQGRSLMNDIEMAFAKEIYLYNEKVINDIQKPNLLENFCKLSQKLNDKNIEEVWTMLKCMCDLQQVTSGFNSNDNIDLAKRTSVQMQIQFANNAIRYLEMTFKKYLNNLTSSNLEQARLGGVPGTLRLINAYLRLNPSKYYNAYDDMYENQPLWAIIYLCLRCGDYTEARDVALKAEKNDIAQCIDELINNLNLSNNTGINYRHLSSINENKLKLEYKGRIRKSADVYKRAVYRYLSHYLIEDDLSDVLDNVDDFLWFNLSTITFNNTTPPQQQQQQQLPSDVQTYQKFQIKMSQEFGEKYFNKATQNPYTYIQVLILTSQFELLIEYLLKYETLIVHAIHIAVALYEKSLLILTHTPSNAQLISKEANDDKIVFRINFASLIKIYTRKFECTDPRDAIEYYYFLRNIYNVNVQQLGMNDQQDLDYEANYFALNIAELAIETREFELLFGKLEKNGARKAGAIDKFLSSDDNINNRLSLKTDKIIKVVAKEIELKGLVEEAIKLYDLCKEQQRVLELCNKLISPHVTELNVENSNRDRLKQMALSIAQRYKYETQSSTIGETSATAGGDNTLSTSVISMSSRVPILKSTSITFYLLCDLMSFFDIYHAENWDLAYETLNRLNVLPVTSDNIESKVKQFTAFSEEIKRNFPDLILAAMNTICHLYMRISKSSPSAGRLFGSPSITSGDSTRRANMNQLKEHAKALIKFVGCIPYRLPGDTNARLLQLEVLMN